MTPENKLTQQQLILEYIKEFGEITPAKMCGKIYKNQMCGSDFPKRCRELRKSGKLESRREGKFEVYKLKSYFIGLTIPVSTVGQQNLYTIPEEQKVWRIKQ